MPYKRMLKRTFKIIINTVGLKAAHYHEASIVRTEPGTGFVE